MEKERLHDTATCITCVTLTTTILADYFVVDATFLLNRIIQCVYRGGTHHISPIFVN